MATISVTENKRASAFPSAIFATHIITITSGTYTNSGDIFTVPAPSMAVRYNTSDSDRDGLSDKFFIALQVGDVSYGDSSYCTIGPSSLSANTDVTIPSRISSWNITASEVFNSTNPTVASLPLTWQLTGYAGSADFATLKRNEHGSFMVVASKDYASGEIIGDASVGVIKLNAPPTFDTTSLSIDTSSAYAGVTTASVDVSNLSALYGGYIAEAKLTIGNQSATRANNGTISIPLNTVGTFAPTVSVTDSRGQVATQTLDAITVHEYTSPSVSFLVQRTLATGVPSDDGEYGTITATFNFSDVVARLTQPTVTVDGTSATVTWYSTRATDGSLSGAVNWSALTSPTIVYGVVSTPNTQESCQITVTPIDSNSSGAPITQTLASAFYTIDFLAGGHGIAFGQPATQDGFECNMPTTFHDMVTAEDATQFDGTATFGNSVYIDLPNYTTTDDIDKEIYDALDALGWTDCIVDI